MEKTTKFGKFLKTINMSKVGFIVVLTACIIGMITAIVVPSVTARARSAPGNNGYDTQPPYIYNPETGDQGTECDIEYNCEYYTGSDYGSGTEDLPPELGPPPQIPLPKPPTVIDPGPPPNNDYTHDDYDYEYDNSGSGLLKEQNPGPQETAPQIATVIFFQRPFNGVLSVGNKHSVFFIQTRYAIIELKYDEAIINVSFTQGNLGPSQGTDIVIQGLTNGSTTLFIRVLKYQNGTDAFTPVTEELHINVLPS